MDIAIDVDGKLLPGDTEEAVSLLPFSALLAEALAADKTLLLADVETAGTGKTVLHSHYLAHNINKVIFRSEAAKRKLHRIKANNPLNNMPIQKGVRYFAVDRSSHRRTGEAGTEIYAARYYASEGDYLSRKTIRTFFHSNALAETDSRLLELERSAPTRQAAQEGSAFFRNIFVRNGLYLFFFALYIASGILLFCFTYDTEAVFLIYCLVIILLVVLLSSLSAYRTQRFNY